MTEFYMTMAGKRDILESGGEVLPGRSGCQMTFIPRAHEIYRHFKGNLYQIVAVAEHTETGEQLVIYQAMYGSFQIYARPLAMFTSRVDRAKYPSATQEFRFELQGPDAVRQRRETAESDGEMSDQWDGTSRQIHAQEQVSDEAEPALDPMVLEFLDADTYEERLNILAGIHHRITNEMITTMAIACDVEVEDGDVEQRYEELKQCLLMKDRFEIKRLL